MHSLQAEREREREREAKTISGSGGKLVGGLREERVAAFVN